MIGEGKTRTIQGVKREIGCSRSSSRTGMVPVYRAWHRRKGIPIRDLALSGKRPAHEYNPTPAQGISGKLSWICLLDFPGCAWVAEQRT